MAYCHSQMHIERSVTVKTNHDKDVIKMQVTTDLRNAAEIFIDFDINLVQYVDANAVATMPRESVAGNNEVCFFQCSGETQTDSELAQEYELKNLVPCKPLTLCNINIKNPSFSKDYPNGTIWRVDGVYYFTTFGAWNGGQQINVGCNESEWLHGWWWAGIPK